MSNQPRNSGRPPAPLPTWGAVLIGVIVVAVWLAQQRETPPSPEVRGPAPVEAPTRPPAEAPHVEVAPTNPSPVAPTPRTAPPKRDDRPPRTQPPREVPAEAESPYRFHQKIRNRDGGVLYDGEIDLEPTLDRIARGERLRFPNDGSTFQNRERRLPRQPSGYYREYVHPTPGDNGPGPQRIVQGKNGETYYTPDHYRTFRRLDAE